MKLGEAEESKGLQEKNNPGPDEEESWLSRQDHQQTAQPPYSVCQLLTTMVLEFSSLPLSALLIEKYKEGAD